MKKSLRKLSICRETLRQLENIDLREAAGAEPTKFTSDITNCRICPVYPVDTL
jgi:hypothetical protein